LFPEKLPPNRYSAKTTDLVLFFVFVWLDKTFDKIRPFTARSSGRVGLSSFAVPIFLGRRMDTPPFVLQVYIWLRSSFDEGWLKYELLRKLVRRFFEDGSKPESTKKICYSLP